MTGRAEMSGHPPPTFASPPAPPCWRTLVLRSSSEPPAHANLLSLAQSHVVRRTSRPEVGYSRIHAAVSLCADVDFWTPPENPAAAAGLLLHSAGVFIVMYCTNLISHIKRKRKRNIWL